LWARQLRERRLRVVPLPEVRSFEVLGKHHGGVIKVGDQVYGHSDTGGWVCQEFKTGKTVWKSKGVGKGAIAYADGHLYCRSESGKGTVALIVATPEGYVEKGRFDQPDRSNENSWAHPVVAGGRLYLRDQDVLLSADEIGHRRQRCARLRRTEDVGIGDHASRLC